MFRRLWLHGFTGEKGAVPPPLLAIDKPPPAPIRSPALKSKRQKEKKESRLSNDAMRAVAACAHETSLTFMKHRNGSQVISFTGS